MTIRRLIINAHDVFATAAALLLGFFLRFGPSEFWVRFDSIAAVCVATLPVAVIAYQACGLDRSPWKFVSIADLYRIALAAAVPAMFLVVADFLSRGALVVPRTVPVIYWFVQVFSLAGPRVLYRLSRTRTRERRAFKDVYRVPVLIAGTGDDAERLIRQLGRDSARPLEPVALLTTKLRHVGEQIGGVPVAGLVGDLEAVLCKLDERGVRPRRIVLTREFLKAAVEADELLGTARRLGLAVLRPLDGLAELPDAGDRVTLTPVSIDDLLGRASQDIDLASARRLVAGRRIAVTGAGGSIGSELCRQTALLGAAELLLFDHSELALYSIGKELRIRHPGIPVTPSLGHVGDRLGLARVFATFRPDLVFHAAALKHVDIVEAHPVAAAATNTLGTHAVAEATLGSGATCAVFISTDKAVDPVSILGATKRAGELIWAEFDRRRGESGPGTRFLTVRFGNVLGSSGSVIPLFTEQLRAGGPITVTHPDVERYFMTIGEAVRLVLLASALGVEAPSRTPTFVLDMGRPVKIVDLARRMIRLAGLEPDTDVDIVFEGLRPGERLTEILQSAGEKLRETTVPGVRATDPILTVASEVDILIESLREAVLAHDAPAVIGVLQDMVAEYRPEAMPSVS